MLDYPLVGAASADEALTLRKHLEEKGLITGQLAFSLWSGSLTPDGVEEVERIQRVTIGNEPPAISDTSSASKGRKRPERFDTMSATYKRVRNIGEGGSGFVDEVTDESGQGFALKMLNPDRVTSEKRKRFKNEVESSLRFGHPNVVKTLDAGFVWYQEIKCPFYVMKLYDGTLRALMTSRIDSDLILSYFRQILDGVQAIHERESYHRDLKPENILFDKANDTLIVADLGIAHFQQELLATAIETDPRTKLANFQYAAPEQTSRTGEVDHRADIFALGLMLNEMFTGKVPQGHNYVTIARSQPKFKHLDSLVELMIDQNPSQRPQSIEQVKKQLDE